MFLWHVGKRCEQHFGWKPPHNRRAFGNRRQVPVPARQHFGDAEQFAAAKLPSHRMAITVENLDQAGFNKKKMRCHLGRPEQGLAMEKRYAGDAVHEPSPRQAPLCDLGGNRA